MLTNARSLSPKIDSLHTMFDEHNLDFAMITESWLKDGQVLNRDVIDLEFGTDKKIIYRNRPKNSVGARKVGGGVSIVYNKSKCSFRERKIVGNKFELVAAVGKVGKLARMVCLFCLYIEPRMKVAELTQLNGLLEGEILSLKAKNKDPIIMIGGDLNRRDITPAFTNFVDIRQINFDPTRRGVCLDVLYSNFSIPHSHVWPPLETKLGTKSDHDCVVFLGEQQRAKDFVWIKKTTRAHSDKAVAKFGEELKKIDWRRLLPEDMHPDDMVEKYESITTGLVDKLFPMRTVRQRSNEQPWISNGVRRLARRRNRLYKREGKSPRWHELQRVVTARIERNKVAYVDRVEEHGTSTRTFFNAVKTLSGAGKDVPWAVTDLFPESTEEETGTKTLEYFTKITDQFQPLTRDDVDNLKAHRRAPLTLDEVTKLLAAAKKPNSTVEGDILPRLMKAHHEAIALPAMLIFNCILLHQSWPKRWKVETAVIIPKNSNPTELGECRNISCTPFLSKVMETVLLADLREEIQPDPTQYGGVRACSVNHLLVDLLDEVLGALDVGDPAVVLGIDFEKAFNRLDHRECIKQLELLGASPCSLALVASFLQGRVMQVKIGSKLTGRKLLKGGSPQGSILGCLLYCLTTQQLRPGALAVGGPPASPATPPDGLLDITVDSPTPDDVGMNLLPHPGQWEEITPNSSPEAVLDPVLANAAPPRGILFFRYVDDSTTVERVSGSSTTKHFTTARTLEDVPAPETQSFLTSAIGSAEAIGMRINCKKTQALCVSTDNGCNSTSTINTGMASITSVDSIKLLGFHLSSDGSLNHHIKAIHDNFRRKFWSLIHLRGAGFTNERLYRMYIIFVRPILEANHVIFHSMITRQQAAGLESLQALVLRLCFGAHLSYAAARAAFNIQTLEARREEAVRKFVNKSLQNERFRRKWFIPREAVGQDLRRRIPYVERRAHTKRYYRSPLLYMQRVANQIAIN